MRRMVLCFTLFLMLALVAGGGFAQNSPPCVRVHYLGHAAFVLQFDNGITVVTDYGHENIWKEWGWDSPILSIGSLQPDVMTFSHKHDDHYDPDRIPASVKHVLSGRDSLDIGGIKILPVFTDEDDPEGESNTSYIFLYREMRICHMGDAQAYITNIDTPSVREAVIKKFPRQFDLLIMPVEGKQQFIPQAAAFLRLLHPRVMIPAHFWSEDYLERFLQFVKATEPTGPAYRIVRSGQPVFGLVTADTDDPARVVVLKRAPIPDRAPAS